MIKRYKQIIDALKNNQDTMVKQLHHFCEINSGTNNLPGLIQMANALQVAYKPIADAIQIKKLQQLSVINMSGDTAIQSCGDALFIRKRPHLKRRILLSGHMDTVYPANSPFQKLTYINDNYR